MPEDFVQVAPDSTGAKVRTRQRTIGANTVEEQYVIVQPEAVAINRVWLSTLRVPTRALTAAATQPMFSIWNGIASGGNMVSIRRLTVEVDSATAYAGYSPFLRLYRTTAAATGGTVITPVSQYLADPAFSTSVAVRADHQADGAVATTALAQTGLGTQPMWSQTLTRMHTGAGFVPIADYSLLPNDGTLIAQDPLILRPGEGMHVQFVNGGVATTATGVWFTCMFKCVLAEFTYP